jgi:hypothetical protein
VGFCFAVQAVGKIAHCRPLHADAMQLFAQSQDKWSKSWPQSEEDRAMRMYVVFSTLSTRFEVNRADV